MGRKNSPLNFFAAFCSFFIPGFGQLLQGRHRLGIFMFLISAALWWLLLGWIIHLWSSINAVRFSKNYQEKNQNHEKKKNKYTNEKETQSNELVKLRIHERALNLNKEYSVSDIKKNYRTLSKKYHPDVVESLGEEFKELAHNKMKEINKAYEFLMNYHSKPSSKKVDHKNQF